MYLQLIISFITLVLYIIYSSQSTEIAKDNDSFRITRKYITIVTIILILQSALRNVAVGADTYAYFLRFEELKSITWEEIISTFYDTYIEGDGKDPGYNVFVKLIQIIITDYQLFLLIIAIFFFCGLAKMFKIMELDIAGVCAAVLVYEVLYYSFFSITGIRQTVATGIFFWAFSYLRKRKLLPFLLLMLVAATIHKSSLILIPFYFIANLRYSRKFLIVSLIAFPFIIGVAREFASIITSIQLFQSYSYLSNSTYETQGAINFTIFLILSSILTLCSFNEKQIEHNTNLKICINALSLAILFVPLTWVDPTLMRVCQYFSVFNMFLIGPVLQKFCDRYNLSLFNFLTYTFIVFCFVIIKRGGDYGFFGEDMLLPDYYIEYIDSI